MLAQREGKPLRTYRYGHEPEYPSPTSAFAEESSSDWPDDFTTSKQTFSREKQHIQGSAYPVREVVLL